MPRPPVAPASRSVCFSLRARCRRVFAVALVVGLAGLVGEAARAQHTPTPETTVGPTARTSDRTVAQGVDCDENIVHLLRTGTPAARTAALNELIRKGRQKDRDLPATVGPLLDVIGTDPRLSRRLKAIEALQSLGPDDLFTSLVASTVDRVVGLLPGTEECPEEQRRA